MLSAKKEGARYNNVKKIKRDEIKRGIKPLTLSYVTKFFIVRPVALNFVAFPLIPFFFPASLLNFTW